MKTSKQLNRAGSAHLSRLCLGACVLGAPVIAASQEPGERLEDTTRADFSVGGALVDGNRAAFQQRRQIPAGAFGGVETFLLEKDIAEGTRFRVDGRGIFEAHDYLLRMELVNPEFGYLRAGFREFRTWYDGSGGYFPPSELWLSVYDEKMHLDKGEAWIEAGLTLPNWPVLNFRYSHQYRDGRKDSTIWGDTGLTGLTGAFGGNRAVVPSFRDIDERRNIFEGRLSHTLGNTDFGAGLRYEFSDQDNALQMRRRPGESQDRHLTQREGVETDIWSTHAWTRTRLHEKVQFSLGYLFSSLDTDLSGSRIYGPDYDPLYDPTFARRQQNDSGFINLAGGSKAKQHVGHVNFMITPLEHFFIVPSLRLERQDIESAVNFFDTSVGGSPAFAASQTPRLALSEREVINVSERLELRYTGLQRWMFYARGDWTQGQGDLMEQRLHAGTGALQIDRFTDFDRDVQKYTAGANWYPARSVNVGLQYYHKVRENRYDHLPNRDSTSNVPPSSDRYPAFITAQDFTTDDVNVRLTLRPFAELTLVSRYDYQLSTIDTVAPMLPTIESGKMTSHIFSQNATWMPLTRLYLQASVSYAMDRTETPADKIRGNANAAWRVLRAENEHLTTAFNIGYALNDKTDLDAAYFYYLADNYEDNSLYSVPYGSGQHEHGVTVGLARRIRDNMFLGFKYGFFSFRDDASGGNRNYDAHLLYSSLSLRF